MESIASRRRRSANHKHRAARQQLLVSFWLLLSAFCSPALGETFTVTAQVAVRGAEAKERSADNSNAVVWLTPLGEAASADGVAKAANDARRYQLLQKNKRFDPHVLVVPVGSMVDFPNLDPFFHNVFSLFDGKRFDLGLYEAGTTHMVRFDRSGICYIFCNIHPQMSAVVVVLKTPYFGISNRAGTVTIPRVPAGPYQVQVWQERCLPATLAAASREVAIAHETTSLGTIALAESADLLSRHKNKYGRDYDSPTPPSPLYDQEQ